MVNSHSNLLLLINKTGDTFGERISMLDFQAKEL
jgi:hypothetical protein